MKFNSAFSERELVSQPVGSKFMATYEYSIDEKGHKSLVKTGEKDIYTPIQEALESTLIENILQRAALGDPLALEQVHGQYIDTTDMPKSLAEAQNKIIDLKNKFNNLPIEVRKEFNFSPEQFIHEFGSNDWLTKMGYIKPEETAPEIKTETKEEVKVNE